LCGILEIAGKQRTRETGDAIGREHPTVVAADVLVAEIIRCDGWKQRETAAVIKADQRGNHDEAVNQAEANEHMVGHQHGDTL
jgi:hypothetical protein